MRARAFRAAQTLGKIPRMSTPNILSYRGSAGLDDMGAFNARASVGWKGDMLFRVYLTDSQAYFIKVGGAKKSNQAMAFQFGLLGALIVYLVNKRNKEKTQKRLNEVAGVSPDDLLAQDKVNHVIPLGAFADVALRPRSFWKSAPFGAWFFRDAKGKKRFYTFDDAENFQIAAQRLSDAFGTRLEVTARWDAEKAKVIKIE
jgi:hypothetical protein